MSKENQNVKSTTGRPIGYDPVLCPVCGEKVDVFFESSVKQPFAHINPMAGLTIYGPYSSDKDVKCQNEDYIHFVFADNESRLVKLGCDFDKMDGETMPY